MNIFMAPRGKGKTTELVRASLRSGIPIVCFNKDETYRVDQLLKQEVRRISAGESKLVSYKYAKPININQIENKKVEHVLVDNLDLIFQNMFPKLNVVIATLTSE
jgi:hypothetical protein